MLPFRPSFAAVVSALAFGAAGAGAQDLGARIAAVRDGTVRFEFAAAEGVCGNGRGNIQVHRPGDRRRTGQGGEWVEECEPGPVRVAVDRVAGRVTAVRAYVGGRWRGAAERDLGPVAPTEASDWLLGVAESGNGSVAKDAIFPATIAEGVHPWRRLLALAKDQARPREVRSQAVFWVGQEAADAATRGLQEVVDADGDQEVRKSAVFALSQRPKDESVPSLIRIARTHRDPEIRRTAIFWLGQSGDPRAVAYFEEVLVSR